MSNYIDFLLYRRINSDSTLESIGDTLLTPVRYITEQRSRIINPLHRGREYVLLSNGKQALRVQFKNYPPFFFEKKASSLDKMLVIGAKVVMAALLPIALVGACLKAASLFEQSVRDNFCNWQRPDIYQFQRSSAPVAPSFNANFPRPYAASYEPPCKTTKDLWDEIRQKELTGALVQSVATHTLFYTTFENNILGPSEVVMPLFGFSECACVNARHNRYVTDFRTCIEDDMLKELQKRFILEKTSTIRLLSLGSGKLLQDFIILSKLIQAGYRNIHIDFVDPATPKSALTSMDEIALKLKCSGVMLSTAHTTSVTDSSYHCISAVDFDGIIHTDASYKNSNPSGWQDFLKAKKQLVKDGLAYISFRDEIFRFSDTGTLKAFKIWPIEKQFIEACLKKFSNCPVRMAVSNSYHLQGLLASVQTLLTQGCRPIVIDVCHNEKFAEFEPILAEYFTQLAPSQVEIRFVNALNEAPESYDLIHLFTPKFSKEEEKSKLDTIKGSLRTNGSLFYVEEGVGVIAWQSGTMSFSDFSKEFDRASAKKRAQALFC